MDFGPVPVSQAKGAILAHSVGLPDGRLRKGVLLNDAHIARLTAAEVAEVVVARLGAKDIHEDAAAAALAKALVPDVAAAGLRLTAAFTGRVNVVADGPGVVQLDAAKINAANAVNPMITVATVPDMHQMDTGGMVATIKIISYGVPEQDVTQACLAAMAAMRLCRPVFQTASLIVSDIPGGPGLKGTKAIAARIDRLGMRLVETVTVPHASRPISAAICAAKADLVLILTGSATSDVMDVAPTAVRAIGGQVTRFGMPVDPGNLLFLGDVDGKPVIGLPGCARAPALNGADWVLSRVACGIAVSNADIAAMGVGGLLKEIPTRPMPRAGRKA